MSSNVVVKMFQAVVCTVCRAVCDSVSNCTAHSNTSSYETPVWPRILSNILLSNQSIFDVMKSEL
jgi:hypothetical protein